MNENIENNTTNTDLSSLVSNLLSNPDAISKMSNIISNLSSNANSDNSPPNNENKESEEESKGNIENNRLNNEDSSPTFQNFNTESIISNLPNILSKLSSQKDENSLATKQQITLLLAIRPYLSEHRKELIDTFIKMNKLGAIFKNLA